MATQPICDCADDFLAARKHLLAKPLIAPSNILVVAQWQAVGDIILVSCHRSFAELDADSPNRTMLSSGSMLSRLGPGLISSMTSRTNWWPQRLGL